MRFRTGLLSVMLCALGALPTTPAASRTIEARFIEGAPTDRFEIKNVGDCPVSDLRVVIDLVGSQGELYFDTTGSGAGELVFQPFELDEGADRVSTFTPVNDGDRRAELSLRALPPGETVSFTVDVDDQAVDSALGRTQVSGSEIAGASLRVGDAAPGAGLISGAFGADARAEAAAPGCAASS